MKDKKHKKVCFIASSGGHFEQLLMLKPLMIEYTSFIVTEKTKYSNQVEDIKTYYVHQINRKEILFLIKLMINVVHSLKIIIKEKPEYFVSLGALSTVPISILAKVFRKKLIFIESFAKVNSATVTGKLMYKLADQFYVQWEDMKKVYPNAIYIGGIY